MLIGKEFFVRNENVHRRKAKQAGGGSDLMKSSKNYDGSKGRESRFIKKGNYFQK